MAASIIIPTLDPDANLVPYVQQLMANGFRHIVIVNDGSKDECRGIFDALSKIGCTILTHYTNMGKGRALKDAFNHCLLNPLSVESGGVITVDSDGQHTVEDVVKINQEMQSHPNALILGARDFNDESVPPKSKIGNKLTRIVLKVLIGGDISDTQTGLRGIPIKHLEKWSVLFGERFEYETMMLIDSIQSKLEVREVKIRTVYIDDNRETHFHPVRDSFAIYKVLFATFLKYILSSVLSFVIDYGIFCCLIAFLVNIPVPKRIWAATIIARAASSLFNYAVNRTIVFNCNSGNRTIVSYYILCVMQMVCSAFLVAMMESIKIVPVQIIKIIVDTFLFLLSFQIQRKVIFKEKIES